MKLEYSIPTSKKKILLKQLSSLIEKSYGIKDKKYSNAISKKIMNDWHTAICGRLAEHELHKSFAALQEIKK